MSSTFKRKLTPAEYLRIERAGELRREFLDGEMSALANASWAHSLIKDNLAAEARDQLRGDPSRVVATDQRVKVEATGLYTYPDILIVWDEPQFEDAVLDTLLNPQVIVEVLAKATEKYDRDDKFRHYRQVPSLREYVLVAQHRMCVERFVRQTGKSWLHTTFTDPAQPFTFGTLPVTLPLPVIYANVRIPKGTSDSRPLTPDP